MGKKIYLTIIWLLVLLAIIVGIGIHVMDWFSFDQNLTTSETSGELTDTIEVEAFDSVKAELGFVDLAIEYTSGEYKVSYEASAEKYVPTITVNDGTLLLSQKSFKVSDGIGTKDKTLAITIYVPENTEFKELDLEVGASDVNLENVVAQSLDVDSGAGNITLKGGAVSDLSMDVGAGDVDVIGIAFDSMDLDAGAGDVSISGIGDVSQYSFDIDMGIGDLTIDGKKQSGLGSEYKTTGSTNKKIEIDGGAGNIVVSE